MCIRDSLLRALARRLDAAQLLSGPGIAQRVRGTKGYYLRHVVSALHQHRACQASTRQGPTAWGARDGGRGEIQPGLALREVLTWSFKNLWIAMAELH
eukprot:3699217-Rhodomonas_salina.5